MYNRNHGIYIHKIRGLVWKLLVPKIYKHDNLRNFWKLIEPIISVDVMMIYLETGEIFLYLTNRAFKNRCIYKS